MPIYPADHPRSILQPYHRPALFITATGTDIGKSTVAAALAGALHNIGARVGTIKPVASGCQLRRELPRGAKPTDDDYNSLDAETAARAAKLDPTDEKLLPCLSPVRYATPTSPHIAARMEGRQPDWHRVAEAFDYWEENCDALIIEGVGGWRVPLDQYDFSVADLAATLHVPVVVVTQCRVGTLNDTLLTVDSIRQRGLVISGMVVNQVPENPDAIIRANLEELPRITGVAIRALLPQVDDGDGPVTGDALKRLTELMIPFARQWWASKSVDL